MKKIKIGQIGVSHEHAEGKINSLRKMTDVFEIIGVVDDRNTRAAKFNSNNMAPYEGLKFMTEEKLFSISELQAVAVETPNLELVPTALRCMERGLAMHMDKPGGDDLELFAKLRKGCEERNLPFQMGYMFRGNPAMQWCIKAARENWLGDIFEIQGSMSHNYGGDVYQKYIATFKDGVKLIGSTLRSRTSEMKAEILSGLEEKLWKSFSSGDIKVTIHKTLPIEQAAEAHALLENNDNLGKVVLINSQCSQ